MFIFIFYSSLMGKDNSVMMWGRWSEVEEGIEGIDGDGGKHEKLFCKI